MTLKIHNYNGQNKAIELNTSTVYGVMKYNTEYTMPVDGYIWFSSVNPGLESTLSLVAIQIKDTDETSFTDKIMFEAPQTYKPSGNNHYIDVYNSSHNTEFITWSELLVFFCPMRAGTKFKLVLKESSSTRMLDSSGKIMGDLSAFTNGWLNKRQTEARWAYDTNGNPVTDFISAYNSGYIVRGDDQVYETSYDGDGHEMHYFLQNQLPQIIRGYYIPFV